jgi:hypothetical protein
VKHILFYPYACKFGLDHYCIDSNWYVLFYHYSWPSLCFDFLVQCQNILYSQLSDRMGDNFGIFSTDFTVSAKGQYVVKIADDFTVPSNWSWTISS